MERNILVTDVQIEKNGESENVLIFTDYLTVEDIKQKIKGIHYNEIYEIKDEERQYYLYEPLWMYKEKPEFNRY